MDKVTGDYAALCRWEEPTPLRRPVPTHVKTFRVNADALSEEELETEVQCLRLHKVVGHTHLRAEYFKQWLQEACPAERTSTPPSPERWQKLVEINQFIW